VLVTRDVLLPVVNINLEGETLSESLLTNAAAVVQCNRYEQGLPALNHLSAPFDILTHLRCWAQDRATVALGQPAASVEATWVGNLMTDFGAIEIHLDNRLPSAPAGELGAVIQLKYRFGRGLSHDTYRLVNFRMPQ
jgi:hypothetical protein